MNGFSSNQQSQYFGESKAELIARRKEKEKRRDDLKWAKLPLTTKLGGLLKDKEAAHNSGDIAERDRLDGEINALEIEIKPYTDAIKILNQEIKDINMILRNPGSVSASVRQGGKPQVAAEARLQRPEAVPGSQPHMRVEPSLNEPSISKPGLPGQNLKMQSVPFQQASMDIAAPARQTFNGKLAVPTLVRLDQQPLSLAEKMYPAMGYDEHVYEPWSDEVKQQVQTKHPEFANQQAAIQPRIPDSPADLDDPDYFPLPENPRFMDLYHHDVWKKKKLL